MKLVSYVLKIVSDGKIADKGDFIVRGVRRIGQKILIGNDKLDHDMEYVVVGIRGGALLAMQVAPEPTDTAKRRRSGRADPPVKPGASPRRRNQEPISVSPRGARRRAALRGRAPDSGGDSTE